MTMITTRKSVFWHTFSLTLVTDRYAFIFALPEVFLAFPWTRVMTVLSGVSSSDTLEDCLGRIPEASTIIRMSRQVVRENTLVHQR